MLLNLLLVNACYEQEAVKSLASKMFQEPQHRKLPQYVCNTNPLTIIKKKRKGFFFNT